MEVLKNIKVPTGNILIVKGDKGKLELLSIGDYGKAQNIKADFLGFKEEIHGVPHGELMPLEDKWVITISSQYGCSMSCKFCDVPTVGPGINATKNDIINQVSTGIKLHPEVKHTKRLNVHYARMGEPTYNWDIIEATFELKAMIKNMMGWGFHPVISTMLPKNNKHLLNFLQVWCGVKNHLLKGEAGLQFSINTTDEEVREATMPETLTLHEIAWMGDRLPMPIGRKYALNFALTDAEIDGELLASLFDSDKFMCKITPMHVTKACIKNNLLTKDGYTHYYPYEKAEQSLKDAGFDVIVFIPSIEEDEGRITCGNAILSGNMPSIEYEEIV